MSPHLFVLLHPWVVFAASVLLANKSVGIFLIFGFMIGMAGLFLAFGGRLWLHHAALILPMLYASLALSLEYTANKASLGRLAAWTLALPLLLLGIGNAIDRQTITLALERTGGVGLASDAIDRFAQDSAGNPDPTFGFFPDWGIFMPFEMVTGGRIPLKADPAFNPSEVRRKLCEGRDALLAIINDRGVDRLPPWIDAVGWGAPEIVVYRQRDDVPVLTSVRWRPSALAHPACG